MRHELKTWPEFFRAILDGKKTFELRRDDRPFAEGDTLELREWDQFACEYTGASMTVRVTYMIRGPRFGLEKGYCIMSIAQEGK